MGDAADDFYFHELGKEFKREKFIQDAIKKADKIITDYAFGDLTWKAKNGHKFYIHEMTVSHIKHCLCIVKKKDNLVNRSWIRVFNQELRKRNKL